MHHPLNNKPSPDQTRPHTPTHRHNAEESTCLCYCLLLRTGLQMVNVSRRSRQRGLMGEASVLSLTATGRQVERDNMLVADGGWEISAILPLVFSAVSLSVLLCVVWKILKIAGLVDFFTVIVSHAWGDSSPKNENAVIIHFPSFCFTHLYSFLSCVEHKISYFEAQGGVKFTRVLLILFGKIRLFQIGNAIENLAWGRMNSLHTFHSRFRLVMQFWPKENLVWKWLLC